jgi:predicted amidohydrolase
MRIVLAELRPQPGRVGENLGLLERALGLAGPADLVAFPELYLSGYSVGDRLHRLALHPGSREVTKLQGLARECRTWVCVGAPYSGGPRKGETQNVALLLGPEGQFHVQGKRYLPTFGPFEESRIFSPAEERPLFPTPFGTLGIMICYEVFFPEISRLLAMGGADLILVISASPVTSRSLFEKLLPARAVENATAVAYVNRIGVEDSLVFAGGSGAWDPRGEPLPSKVIDLGREGRLLAYDLPLQDFRHFRPMRPVLRDLGSLG